MIIVFGIFIISLFSVVFALPNNLDSSDSSLSPGMNGPNGYGSSNNSGIIGGQRDSHGCLGPAGYSWNESEMACVREWENGTARYQNDSDFPLERFNNREIRMIDGPNGRKFIMGNFSFNCSECNFTRDLNNSERFQMHLSNGRFSDIKIMPEVANERALERLRIRVCNESQNCTMVLKEVGQGNETRPIYEVNATGNFRLFGLFKTRAKESVQIDSSTGEVISLKRPWWSFISTKSD